MTISTSGHIRVGIDWEDKGYVEFERDVSDPLNLKPSWMTRFRDEIVIGGVESNGDIQHLFYPQSSFNFTTGNTILDKYVNAINPYGAELTRVTLDATETYGGISFTKTVDSEAGKWDVSPSTEYTIWTWISADAALVTDDPDFVVFQAEEYDSGDTLITQNGINLDLVTPFRIYAVKVTFTTDATTDYIALSYYRDFVSSPPLVNIFIHGAALYAGNVTTEPRWNAGSTDGHLDDITDYVLSASGSIGKNQWEQLIFDEGNLSLELNNADRRFSPEYVSSPYYGLINPHRRVFVLFADYDGVYHFLWSGWTHQLMLNTGIHSDRRATLTARQGRFMFESQDPASLVALDEINSSQAIQALFGGGYKFSTGSNESYFSGETVLQNYSLGLDIPIFGVAFVADPQVRDFATTLENVSEINGNYIFLTRYGRIFFHTFDEIRDDIADFLPMEHTIDVHYTYAPEDIYKDIIVNYDYYRNDDDVEMQGVDQTLTAGVLGFGFDVHPQFNNRPFIGDVVLDVSDMQPIDYTGVPAFGTASSSFTLILDGIYTYYRGLADNTTDLDYRLSLVSRASGFVWYADEIDQQHIEAGTDDKALANLVYDNPLITSPFMAESFGQLQASRRSGVHAWFDSATVTNRDNDSLIYALTHTLGDTIYIQEEQTGNIPKHVCIIGENWIYDDSFFQMQYTLAPTTGEVGNVCAAEFDADTTPYSLEVTVTQESEANSTILSWLWNFGDGFTSTDENPTPHTYAEDGIYTISLTITTAYCSDVITHDVAVYGAYCLDIDFTAEDGSAYGVEIFPYIFEGTYVPGSGWKVDTTSLAIVWLQLPISPEITTTRIIINTNTPVFTGTQNIHTRITDLEVGTPGWATLYQPSLDGHTGAGTYELDYTSLSVAGSAWLDFYFILISGSGSDGFITRLRIYDDSGSC